MATLSSLRTRCAARFRDASFAIVSSAEWDSYLLEGYERVWHESPYWPFRQRRTTSLTITAGANSVALPSDVQRVTAVFNTTDDISLEQLTGLRAPYELWPSQSETTGAPEQYRIYNGNIEVFPYAAQTTALTVEYTPGIDTTTFDANNEEPAFPEEYHPILVDWALAQAYLDDGAQEMYQVHMAHFQEKLSSMKADLLASDREGQYAQIEDSWY